MKPITLILTCADKHEAQKIADKLLEERLAACVRRVDVNSDYRWKGTVEHADEVQLFIESREDKFDDIEAAVRKIHSYEIFVLMAYPVLKSSKGVDDWLGGEIK